MTGTSNGKRDFFVSFNQADRRWATWIAWMLEDAGYSVFFQDWDFRPGQNFVLEMNRAATLAERTVPVLSPNFFASHFTQPEWAAAFADDPTGEQGRIVPVRVAECDPKGLLGPIVYIDLVGRDDATAKDELLRGVRRERPKPLVSPVFPGGPLSAAARQVPQKPRFPVATHNLPPANSDFVGRVEVLAELHRLLTSGQGPTVITQTITGLDGIGKTQTALAYAYRHLADYRLIWWLRAESAGTLAAEFATLAEPLGLDPKTADQDKLLKEIQRALQAADNWLLSLDNVEVPELPRTYLPTTGSGHVLITSRRTDWHGIAKPLPLEIMPEAEALQLLTGRPDPAVLSPADLAEAKALASDLGYLPLALAQARAYMAETGKSLAGYLRLFRDSRPRVLDQKIRDYPARVAKTWEISINAAAREHLATRPLLELLAFFAPNDLPMTVLAAEPATLPTELQDEFERDKAIAALHRFSLIRAQVGTITVHRLVQAVTRDGLDETMAKARVEAAVRLVNAAFPDQSQDPTNWPAIGALLPHALAVTEAAEQFGVGLEPAARVLNETALYYQALANRGRMLEVVRETWIDGYLKHSLGNLVRIELGLEEKPDAVSRPWDLIMQQPGRAMSAIFDELGQALLILGAPGAGKTTLLLELTRDLLDRAQQDASYPIPVIFHLSSWAVSWAVQRRLLTDWLAGELTERYYVPRKVAQMWTKTEQVLPLLDGLDEVAPEHRAACVEAINEFRQQHGLVPLAVCSRTAEYEALPTRIHLSGAIVIQSLSKPQISKYLSQAGPSLEGLREALRDDEMLWELLDTPLMLSIVTLAYRERSAAEVRAPRALEERRVHLFTTYTAAMFERRTKVTEYTREQTIRWLAWLARSLVHNNLSIFYVEWMQPDWLPSRTQRWIVAMMPIIFGGLAGGLAGGLVYDAYFFGQQAEIDAYFGQVGGLLGGLLGGIITNQIVTRTIPNEGIRQSLRNALISFLISFLIFGLIFGLMSWLAFGMGGGLLFMLLGGLFGGLINGGSAYLQHYILRFLLWRNDYAPLNYIRFLDYAAERVFLRKVGGGYTFTHRLLMEYFATLEPTDHVGQIKTE